jgi:hypothetical protein
MSPNEPDAANAPEQIYIIRHAEKPEDPPAPAANQPAAAPGPPFGVDFDGNQDDHSLLPRGWQRSGALTVLFAPAVGSLRPGLRTPQALFSPSYEEPAKTQAHRTYQTILGLSDRTGLTINSPFPEGEEANLASAVVSSSPKVVLICWEHQHIPALAAAFPLAPHTTIPSQWPGQRFDIVWSFTAGTRSAHLQYGFSQIPQQLLSGDTDTVIQ